MNQLLAYTDKQSYLPNEKISIFTNCFANIKFNINNFIKSSKCFELKNVKIPNKTKYIRINYHFTNDNNIELIVTNSNNNIPILSKENMNNIIDSKNNSLDKFILLKIDEINMINIMLLSTVHNPKFYNFSIFFHEVIPYLKYKLYNDEKYLINFKQSNYIINQLYFNESFLNGCNWTKTESMKIPQDIKSGYYFIKIEYIDSVFYIPIIIKPYLIQNNCTKSHILVLANTNSWNAYNDWNGSSKLFSLDQLLKKNNDNNTIYNSANFCRPNVNSSIAIKEYMNKNIETNIYPNTLIYGEMHLVNFLRSKDLHFDVIADYDFDNINYNLSSYKIFIIHGQAEYWTINELKNINKLHYSYKIHIMYLTSKCCFYKTNYDENSMQVDKEFFIKLKLKNPTIYHEDIFGVSYKSVYNKNTSYICTNKQHWIFKDTNLSNNNFGFKNLISNDKTINCSTIGFTVDAVQKEKFQKYIIARSIDYLCNMVWIDDDDKGYVFSASTVSYVGSLIVDENINKITSNIIFYLINK